MVSLSARAPQRPQQSQQVSRGRYLNGVTKSAGEPQRRTNPRPDLLKAGTKSQPRGLAERERGVEVLLGVVPEVRKPDCRHSCSGATLTKPWG